MAADGGGSTTGAVTAAIAKAITATIVTERIANEAAQCSKWKAEMVTEDGPDTRKDADHGPSAATGEEDDDNDGDEFDEAVADQPGGHRANIQ